MFEGTSNEDLAEMAVETLLRRQKLAAERVKAVAAAQMISKERLGKMVRRVSLLPGFTLEQMADVIREDGLEKF